MPPQAKPDAAIVLHHLTPVFQLGQRDGRLDRLRQRSSSAVHLREQRQRGVGQSPHGPERLSPVEAQVQVSVRVGQSLQRCFRQPGPSLQLLDGLER